MLFPLWNLRKSLSSFFKVVVESLVDAKSWGDIAVDDIKVLNGLNMMDCKGEAFSARTDLTAACFLLALDIIRVSV